MWIFFSLALLSPCFSCVLSFSLAPLTYRGAAAPLPLCLCRLLLFLPLPLTVPEPLGFCLIFFLFLPKPPLRSASDLPALWKQQRLPAFPSISLPIFCNALSFIVCSSCVYAQTLRLGACVCVILCFCVVCVTRRPRPRPSLSSVTREIAWPSGFSGQIKSQRWVVPIFSPKLHPPLLPNLPCSFLVRKVENETREVGGQFFCLFLGDCTQCHTWTSMHNCSHCVPEGLCLTTRSGFYCGHLARFLLTIFLFSLSTLSICTPLPHHVPVTAWESETGLSHYYTDTTSDSFYLPTGHYSYWSKYECTLSCVMLQTFLLYTGFQNNTQRGAKIHKRAHSHTHTPSKCTMIGHRDLLSLYHCCRKHNDDEA